MKRILFAALLLLSLMVCFTSLGCSGSLDDVKAGNAAANKGDYDKAIGLFTKAIESGELSRDDLSKTYCNRGFVWRSKGDLDKAIVDYTTAIEIEPKLANAYNNRGAALHDKGDYDKAIADYAKAISSRATV